MLLNKMFSGTLSHKDDFSTILCYVAMRKTVLYFFVNSKISILDYANNALFKNYAAKIFYWR